MTSQDAATVLVPMRQLDRIKVISFRSPSTSVRLVVELSLRSFWLQLEDRLLGFLLDEAELFSLSSNPYCLLFPCHEARWLTYYHPTATTPYYSRTNKQTPLSFTHCHCHAHGRRNRCLCYLRASSAPIFVARPEEGHRDLLDDFCGWHAGPAFDFILDAVVSDGSLA